MIYSKYIEQTVFSLTIQTYPQNSVAIANESVDLRRNQPILWWTMFSVSTNDIDLELCNVYMWMQMSQQSIQNII